MIWGDQWRCHCGTHNLLLREACRDCGEPRRGDAPTESAEEVMARVAAANAEPDPCKRGWRPPEGEPVIVGVDPGAGDHGEQGGAP